MNIPKAIELAVVDVIKNYSASVPGVVIRPWQTLSSEQAIAQTGEKLFPMIDVRCSAPATEDQVTRYCDVTILCGTYNDDDKNHEQISALYESAQEACDLLHDQFMAGSGEAYALFTSRITTEISGMTIGGVSFSGGNPPYEDSGINFMSVIMRVHYAK
jgi:hypothetical protein